MAALDPIPQDLTILAISRLAAQYTASYNLIGFISVFTDEAQDLVISLFQLLQQRDLDITVNPATVGIRQNAIGAQLDVIGRIVGQYRTLLNAQDLQFFAFKSYGNPDDPTGQTVWGDYNNAVIGGMWISYGQSPTGNYILNDLLYRKFIKIKILKNFTNATTEQLIYIYGQIFQLPGQNPPPIFISEFSAGYLVGVGRILNRNEQLYFQIVDFLGRRLMPKPVGVYMWGYQFDGNNFFGWQGTPGAKPWADYNIPGSGGAWASYLSAFQ